MFILGFESSVSELQVHWYTKATATDSDDQTFELTFVAQIVF